MYVKDFSVKYKMMLPKRIMQTWKFNEVPDKWKKSPEETKRLMPDWDYTLMTDEDNLAFVEQWFPNFKETFLRMAYPIMRADMIRYMWLYQVGGVYYDLDLYPSRRLDELFNPSEDPDDTAYLVVSGNDRKTITNSFMASKPRNPLWLDVLDDIRNNIIKDPKKKTSPWYADLEKHLYVLETTGPGMLTRVLEQKVYNYRILPVDKVNAYSMCDVENYREIMNGNGEFIKNSIMKPLPGSSWVNSSTDWLVKTCYCHSEKTVTTVVIILILLIVVYLLYRRYKSR